MSSIQTTDVTFTNVHELHTEHYLKCIVRITVESKISDNKPIYHIKYKYKYMISDDGITYTKHQLKKIVKPHPFAYCEKSLLETHCYEGDIIYRNSMTEEMVKFLLMPDVELEKVSGTSTVQRYRRMIMFNIARLWD